MKRTAIVILLTLAVLAFSAQTVVYVNSAVVTWYLSNGLIDGSPFPAGDKITYEVVIARPDGKAAPTVLGETAMPPFTVTLPSEGDWLVGVRTVRKVGTERLLSDFLWSDATTDPFVLRLYRGPAAPTGLRLQ